MNKIVLEHYPASKLPDELRRGLAMEASVRITVEEERPPPVFGDEFKRQLMEVRKNLKHHVTLEEAVARVRELRDEWDD